MKSNYFKSRNRQGGFTLVEIAIVLVIVGLLLAGVLKGQEIIENSKIKNIGKDLDSVGAAVLAYRDRYKALPGDDTSGSAGYGWAVTTAIPAGNGDGIIGAAIPVFTGANAEQTAAIRALRAAGFMGGNADLLAQAALPSHAGGGLIAMGGIAAGVWGMTGNVVCLNNLTGKYAGALDRLLDDGVNNTGVIRSNNAAIVSAAPAFAAYNEATTGYFLCKQL